MRCCGWLLLQCICQVASQPKGFPYVSLLSIASLAFIFSLLFRMSDVISGILAMRIIVQFVGQAIGVMLLRKRKGTQSSHIKYPGIHYLCSWPSYSGCGFLRHRHDDHAILRLGIWKWTGCLPGQARANQEFPFHARSTTHKPS